MVGRTRELTGILEDNPHDMYLLQKLRQKEEALQNVNTAMTVLLERYGQTRKEMKEHVAASIRQRIMPYLCSLKEMCSNNVALLEYLDLIESNLKDIATPFSKNLESREFGLTSREIEIANFIKQGKTSKQIAKLLKISTRAVDSHRYNLRKKFGINNSTSNLYDFFRSIDFSE